MDALAAAYAAVVARPRDDEPRVRFAALANSTDAAGAGFVRAQLEVALRRRSAGRLDREVERAARRCLAPPAAHDARWGAPVRAWVVATGGADPAVAWGRGFVESAAVDARWFVAWGAEFRARAPVVDLRISGVPADASTLFEAPALEGVRSLRFVGAPLSMAQVRDLCASPFLRRLAWLDLAYMGLPEAALRALADAELPALRYARLDGNAFPDPNPSLDEQDGAIYGERPSAFAAALIAQHGERAWLHGHAPQRAPTPEAVG